MHFELAGKKTRVVALLATVAALTFLILHRALFLDPELELRYGQALFNACIVGAFGAGLLLLIKPSVDEKYKMFANTLHFFLEPILTMQVVEALNGNFVWNFTVKTFIANYIIYLFFYLVCYFITGRYHMTGLIVFISLYVWGLLNYFIELFRGSPLVPMDFLSARTGLSVSDGYNYELSCFLIVGTMVLLLTYLYNKKSVSLKPKKLKNKIIVKCLTAGYIVVVLCLFFLTDITTNNGFKPDFWNQARGYHNTGSFFNFCLNTKYLVVRKPSGYDPSKTESLIRTRLEDNGVDPDGDTCTNLLTGKNDYQPSADGATPNIIYIMNESLADLRQLGDLETNEEFMPFMDSLTENTIKGYLSMPVFGAGTSNSEFEALSGNSISFLPAGCNVYQSYIKRAIPTLVSTLKTLGYSETAFHPYYGEGWNREVVYPLLGFEDYISIEDFIDQDILDTYKANNDVNEYEDLLKARYPDRDMLLRRFVSDRYDFQMIEDMYENRDTSKPFFVFNVTMQNHGGYAVSYRNFYQQIYATNLSGVYPKANRYLSLVKESDNAFQQIIEYFSNVEEPTIICMFGDHLPSLETEFFEELMGSSLDSLTTEQEQKRFATPFFIWANYDIPEAEVGRISSNYLSVLLQQTAGLPMTAYNKYLASVYQTLPIIDTVGYVDKDGNYYTSSDESPYEDLLNEYSCIEYNALIDKTQRHTSLFYLEE